MMEHHGQQALQQWEQQLKKDIHLDLGTSQSAGLTAGGDPGVARTEEFNITADTVTAAAWASGGNLNTARQRSGGFGAAQTSAVSAGASAPPATALNKTEEYDGTS